ncbi:MULTISPECIES: hypothetical protein [unclassified Rhodanobacter]|uniref:Uncharacterized protein n=1 Tax=Rhodanobacter humi TaxID=1888173 RepID=A0ABV4ARP8_9GAMM
MISNELEIVLLIVALYGSTCVVFAYANEGVLQQGFLGLRLQVADDRLRMAGRSPIWLNPFAPMLPAFRGQWGYAEAITSAPGLMAHIPEAVTASAKLAPYVFAVFLCTVVGIPVTLLLVGAERVLPMVGLAYISTIVMMVRLWFLRDSFSLDGRKFALITVESIACLPFAAGLVRRLSLTVPVTEDLASFVVDMPTELRQHVIETLVERCAEMERFLPEGSDALDRLARYRANLTMFANDAIDSSVPITSPGNS